MNQHLVFARLARALTVGTLVLGQPALATPPPPASQPAAHDHAHHETLAPSAGAKGSIYPLAVPLETQAGARLDLKTFAGHPVIISMFYARCTSACPMLIRDVQKIEAALDPKDRERVRVLLVTLDPARDTPAALTALAERQGADLKRWTFARAASDEPTRELAGALGIKYRRLESGDYNHSSVITLLDREGVALARVEGLAQDSTAFRAVIKTAIGP